MDHSADRCGTGRDGREAFYMTQGRRRAMRYVRTSQQRRVARMERWTLGAVAVSTLIFLWALVLALMVG